MEGAAAAKERYTAVGVEEDAPVTTRGVVGRGVPLPPIEKKPPPPVSTRSRAVWTAAEGPAAACPAACAAVHAIPSREPEEPPAAAAATVTAAEADRVAVLLEGPGAGDAPPTILNAVPETVRAGGPPAKGVEAAATPAAGIVVVPPGVSDRWNGLGGVAKSPMEAVLFPLLLVDSWPALLAPPPMVDGTDTPIAEGLEEEEDDGNPSLALLLELELLLLLPPDKKAATPPPPLPIVAALEAAPYAEDAAAVVEEAAALSGAPSKRSRMGRHPVSTPRWPTRDTASSSAPSYLGKRGGRNGKCGKQLIYRVVVKT